MAETQVNSVSVSSIDEERLKFRVICGINAANHPPGRIGEYKFELPPLTSFGNSNHYNQCTMTCDCVSFGVQDGLILDPTWSDGATFGRIDCIELKADVPSAQTGAVRRSVGQNVDQHLYGQFRQMIPLKCNLIGGSDGRIVSAGIVPIPIGGGANNGLFGTGPYAWQGEGKGDPTLSANPFGDTLTLTLSHPAFFASLKLVSHAAGAGSGDEGSYSFQFTITMVPNK